MLKAESILSYLSDLCQGLESPALSESVVKAALPLTCLKNMEVLSDVTPRAVMTIKLMQTGLKTQDRD